MARIVLLARHGTHAEVGRVLSGRSEIALGERGRAEAAALARWLRATPLAAIHASPRRRTQETAAAVAAQRAIAVTIATALDEIDFGDFAGRSFAALDEDAAWRRWNAERDAARCPGGETMAEAVARADAFLQALPDADAPTLCVTHCDVIRGLVANYLALPFSRMLAFDCDPGSVTTLAVDGAWTRVVALNERPR